MHEQIQRLIACPICRIPLAFDGERSNNRFINGYLMCNHGHIYQVKDEIGILKDAKMSAGEFEWKVDVADEKRYDEIRKRYDSYLGEDQRNARQKLTNKLVAHVIRYCEESDNKVLDIATGMGTFILPLMEKSSEDVLIIGTDIDEKPLRGVMNKARKALTYHKASLIVTDAKHLSFKSQAFSTISSNFGFDNIPEATLSLEESARVLVPEGRIFFSSLWLKENSESMRLAEKHRGGQTSSETRLEKALQSAGLILNWFEKVYSGVWPHNPMDGLPVEGDEYSQIIAQASKPKN